MRRGSLESLALLDPFVVAVAVEGKKEALVPVLYDVWYILVLMSAGFRIGSASCTTKLLFRWYLSGDTDYLVILERIISPLARSCLPEVVVDGILGDGFPLVILAPFVSVKSIVWLSLRLEGTSDPDSLFLWPAVEEPSVVSDVIFFVLIVIVWLSSSYMTLRAGGFTLSRVIAGFFGAP